MATAKAREDFLLAMSKEGVPADVARKVLRYAAKHHRLAEAECNGDWPCDNGERYTIACPRCEMGYVPSVFVFTQPCVGCAGGGKVCAEADTERLHLGTSTCPTCAGRGKTRVCPSCRAEDLITAALALFGVVPVFQGDPRGATVKLKVPSGRTDDWGQTGVCVP